jgi:hypothetical protein
MGDNNRTLGFFVVQFAPLWPPSSPSSYIKEICEV